MIYCIWSIVCITYCYYYTVLLHEIISNYSYCMDLPLLLWNFYDINVFVHFCYMWFWSLMIFFNVHVHYYCNLWSQHKCLPPDLPIHCCFPSLALVPLGPPLGTPPLAPALVTLLVLFLLDDIMAEILVKAKTMNVINISCSLKPLNIFQFDF